MRRAARPPNREHGLSIPALLAGNLMCWLAGNFLADVALTAADPRIRLA